jgi:PAS domain S-box-containing protein
MNVLYVEDDPRDVDLTRRELARSAPQIKLDVASTLSEAHKRLTDANAAYDLVLVDLRLPDGTGLELLEEIRQQSQPLAVVILTGEGDEETAVTALKAGADDYITKRKDYLVRLPLVLEGVLSRFRVESARRAQSLKVLYAEPNASDADLTRYHLARYALHIHLEIVYSASDILQRLPSNPQESCPYDILMLDYRLPGMNALELLKVLYQERGLHLPVVLVTGHGDEEVAVQALRLGATNYLVKQPGYLFKLPTVLENAYYDVQLERERAKLAENEKRFRLLAEHAKDIIYRRQIKPTPSIEYMSPSAAIIIGYTPEEFYADPELSFKLVHPDDRPLLAQVIAGEDIEQPFILRWVRKDGRVIWMEQHTTLLYDENGDLVALEGIARDITRRQEAEIALRVSEAAEHEQRQLAEALRDSAAALISALDLETVMKTLLETAARIVPYDGANIMLMEGSQARPVYWHGYRLDQLPLLQEFSVSVMDTSNLHQMFMTKSSFLVSDTDQYPDWIHQPLTGWVKSYIGSPLCSRGQVIGFLNMDNAVPGFFTENHAQHLQAFADQASLAIERAQLYEEIQHYANDLEQRIAERTAELQQTEARYRAIVEDQTDLVCRFLAGGLLTFVNQAYYKYFNRTPEELLGTSLFDLLPDERESALEHRVAALNSQNSATSVEIEETAADDRTHWFLWNIRMLFDKADNFVEYQGVGRDITERKLAEDQLLKLLGQATRLSELKSRYVSMAAHDLRNPLSLIKNQVGLMQMYSERMTKEQIQTKYESIQNSVDVITDMLDDILTIGQVESGALKYNPATLDLDAFCQKIVEEAHLSSGTTQTIDFSSQGDCRTAYVDAKLLRHILSNLLSNAAKYSPNDTVVTFTLDCGSDQITFRIQDNGIGIPQSEQSQLFEAFHRASNARQISGTGLGLTIVKRSVDLHGGTITVESAEGVGTTFTVILPRTPNEKSL